MTKNQFAENMITKIINKIDNTVDSTMWKIARSLVDTKKLVSILVAILDEYDNTEIVEEKEELKK